MNVFASNMWYVYFMLPIDAAEELNQNYYDMSCVNGATGITGTSFFTQYRRIDIYQ